MAKVEVVRFENSEVRVRVEEDVKNDTCVIIQSTSNPTNTNLMELFLMADALRREEARRVIAMIPYFGYARQDIQHRPGECVSANVIIRFLESIGIHKVYTVNLHDEATEGVFLIYRSRTFQLFRFWLKKSTNICSKTALKQTPHMLRSSLLIRAESNEHGNSEKYYSDILISTLPLLKRNVIFSICMRVVH